MNKLHGNFNMPPWVNVRSYVHQGPKTGSGERMNVQPAKPGPTNLFCKCRFWAFLACFGLVSDEYMNIYKGYRNVTSVFAL